MSEAQIPANPLGTERIGKLLRGFAIPGIISMVINSLYNMVRCPSMERISPSQCSAFA